MNEEEKMYAYWLVCAPGVGDKSIDSLIKAYGTAREIYRQIEKSKSWGEKGESLKVHRKNWNVERQYDMLKKQEIQFYHLPEEEYPLRLKEIPDPPFGLFVKGRLPSAQKVSVAVIGARECSEYGQFLAVELGKTLGRAGVQVISGMARGIDGISQMAALQAGGTSFGVLGCGVDVCYPKSNRELYERLIKEGGILSAYLPGTMPQAQLFPSRNRIVSGLSDVLVVVEARQKSGTLITVDMALEQGRDVYVVPGRLTDRLSDGCNRLIKQGAGILLSPQDLLADIAQHFANRVMVTNEEYTNMKQAGLTGTEEIQGKPGQKEQMQERQVLELQILEQLDVTPKSMDQILDQLSPSVSYTEAMQVLMRLSIKGEVKQVAQGFFCKTVESSQLLLSTEGAIIKP